ncbi:recombination protein RecR [candidate division Kazan bacterium RBG_13_50_9]|uniref:Recombination protein RecR n=1 Tax=candidate division Kazan bacterium RBG_13_50_9 TaxID=1798535 RepID=A0A1F4NRC0_UNCK3|nr:MAG: recombination protein RecR [candidate division Kazan bacterium RBG_13_50_9]
MYSLPKSVSKLINELSKLPGIGPKTASRLAFHLIKNSNIEPRELGEAFINLKSDLLYCSQCHNITDREPCSICTASRRDGGILCIVEEPLDVLAIERSRSFSGRYHVLGGRLSPLEGIGAEDLNLSDLAGRVKAEDITEVIIGTNHNIEGEATAMYIKRLLVPTGVVITRIASGLPMGGDLEYADEVTLARALEGRRSV